MQVSGAPEIDGSYNSLNGICSGWERQARVRGNARVVSLSRSQLAAKRQLAPPLHVRDDVQENGHDVWVHRNGAAILHWNPDTFWTFKTAAVEAYGLPCADTPRPTFEPTPCRPGGGWERSAASGN